jgi:hypothetical protein
VTLPRTASTTADANGAAAVSFTVPSSTVVWDIGQISVETNPKAAACTATLRLDGMLITATSTGSGDTAIGPPTVTLLPGSTLTIVWVNAPAGASCTAGLLYDELLR